MLSLLLSLLGGPIIAADTPCIWNKSGPANKPIAIPDSSRKSPKDSVSFKAGGVDVKVCYSRPALNGRTMIGGTAVPYGQVWRTGANEATMIHLSGHLVIAGVHVNGGTYSLYTVPGEKEWEIIINKSYMQWGHERSYSDSVKAQEVGRGKVPAQKTASTVERFTIRAEPGKDGDANLVLEWQDTKVVIPFAKMR